MNIKTICAHFAIATIMLSGVSCEKQFIEGIEGGGEVNDDKDDNGDNGDKDSKDDKDNNQPTVNVQFNILGVESEKTGTASLKSTCKRLSYSVFDESGERYNYRTNTQLSSDNDFGRLKLSIPKGKYSFVFVAENGKDAPTISKINTVTFKKNKLTDTYHYYCEYDIKEKASYDITLHHSIAKLRVTINDATPQEIDSLSFYYTGGSSTLDPTTGGGNVSSRQTETYSVQTSAHKGKSEYEMFTFPHADARKLKVKISAKSGEQTLYSGSISDITMEQDDVTECSLNFFGEHPNVGR